MSQTRIAKAKRLARVQEESRDSYLNWKIEIFMTGGCLDSPRSVDKDLLGEEVVSGGVGKPVNLRTEIEKLFFMNKSLNLCLVRDQM